MASRLAMLALFACLAGTVMSRRIAKDQVRQIVSRELVDAAETENTKVQESSHVDTQQSVLSLDDLQVGDDPRGPLVPALVPKPGQTLEVMNREALDFFESNAYHWNLVSVTDNGETTYPGKWFAEIDGSFFGNKMGWKTTYVNNKQHQRLFTIHLTKHMWNPTRWTWSFRITHPVTDAILFTVNKDWFGTGAFWMRDEWRVYRGEKGDGEQVYYCASSLTGYEYWCHHNKAEYQNSVQPAAYFSQSLARDLVGLPDSSTLKVEAGEDTALLLATSVIMDMVYEQEQANERAKDMRRRHEREREQRRKRHH